MHMYIHVIKLSLCTFVLICIMYTMNMTMIVLRSMLYEYEYVV